MRGGRGHLHTQTHPLNMNPTGDVHMRLQSRTYEVAIILHETAGQSVLPPFPPTHRALTASTHGHGLFSAHTSKVARMSAPPNHCEHGCGARAQPGASPHAHGSVCTSVPIRLPEGAATLKLSPRRSARKVLRLITSVHRPLRSCEYRGTQVNGSVNHILIAN